MKPAMGWVSVVCAGPYYFRGGEHNGSTVLMVCIGDSWGRSASVSFKIRWCTQMASSDIVCVELLAQGVRALHTEESGTALVYHFEVRCASGFGNIRFLILFLSFSLVSSNRTASFGRESMPR